MARVALEEAVEERAFAGVGTADKRKGEAGADDAAVSVGGGEGGEGPVDGGDAGEDGGLRKEVEIVFDEVDFGFELGDEGDERVFVRSDGAGERAAELGGGEAGLVEGGGLDEVVDGFGGGEVEAAGEEGALGELAGVGEAGRRGRRWRGGGNRAGTGAPCEAISTTSLGGVGVGRGKKGDDGFVKGEAVLEDTGKTGAGGLERGAKLEERDGAGKGERARQADNADAAATGRGGDGDDGVWGVKHALSAYSWIALALELCAFGQERNRRGRGMGARAFLHRKKDLRRCLRARWGREGASLAGCYGGGLLHREDRGAPHSMGKADEPGAEAEREWRHTSKKRA